MNVECQSTIEETGDDEPLTAGDLKAWLEHVPNGASVTAIMRDRGSQRDPMPTLVGLRASWSETR